GNANRPRNAITAFGNEQHVPAPRSLANRILQSHAVVSSPIGMEFGKLFFRENNRGGVVRPGGIKRHLLRERAEGQGDEKDREEFWQVHISESLRRFFCPCITHGFFKMNCAS